MKYLTTILVIGLLLSPFTAFPNFQYEQDGILYTINTDTNEASVDGLADFNRPYGNLIIPDCIQGSIPVTSISDYAFQNQDHSDDNCFTGSLYLGSNIKTIGRSAFYSQHFTGVLMLPDNLTEICEYAFYNCYYFTGILEIPEFITSIGAGAFSWCKNFSSLILSNSIQRIEDNAFAYCGFQGELKLPDSLTSIGSFAFYESGFSGTLHLPAALNSIGNCAFGCNTFVGELLLPPNLKEIGYGAFYRDIYNINDKSDTFSFIKVLSEIPPICRNVSAWHSSPQERPAFSPRTLEQTRLIVPENSIEVYKNTPMWQDFKNISSSEDTRTADIGTNKYLIDINTKEAIVLGIADGNFPFADLIIPDCISYNGEQIPVVEIVANAFSSLYFSGSLSIGNNIRAIGHYAFKDCSRLTGPLKIPASVSTIGVEAFKGCSNLNGELTIPNGITEIDKGTFSGCSKLSGQLTLPKGLTTIGDYAFFECKGLSGSLNLPSGITEIGYDAFYNCTGFNGRLVLPKALARIESSVFAGCSGLTGELIIPSTTTEISYYSFSGCSGLSGSLTIPQSIKVVSDGAFKGCSGLNGTLTLSDSLVIISNSAFEGCSFTGELQIPSLATAIGGRAFYNCKFSGTIDLPEKIKYIGSEAFYGCQNIETVVLPSSLDVYGQEWDSDRSAIQRSAFANCRGLTKIISKKEIPPTCNRSAFSNDTYSTATLLVPTNTLRNYQTTDPWREFSVINSLEPLSAIDFLEANVVCPLGGTVHLYLKKSPAGATGDITFISGNTAVATVDANGVVTGVAKGSTAIIAMSGTLTASCVVTVEDPTIAATALEFEGIIGNVGERVAIGAKVLPADVTDPTISWQSSNPEVAAVDQEGSVWFNAAGSATVTAECQGYEFSVPFVVKEVIAHALNVFPVEAVGGVGHEFSLLALHEPENTTDKSVTWESSDPEVATVSEDGRVSLAAIGSAQITARSGEHSAVCAVTVDETVGLTEMASTGVVIDVVEGGIVVRNAPEGESIAVYAVDGKVVNGAVVDGEETKLNLAAGIYIVKVSPATVGKVLIK